MKITTIVSRTLLASVLLSTFAVAPVQAVDFIALAKDMVHGWLHGNAEWLNEYPVMLQAIYKNDRQAVEDLLASGTDVNEVYSYHLSNKHLLSSDYQDKVESALFFAADYNRTEMCELLLEHGANPNVLYDGGCYYEMPLHIAVKKDNRPMVKALITHKAEVNALTKDKGSFESCQYTPLFWVRSEAVAKMLLDAGADITFRSFNGDSALDLAIRHERDVKVIKCLHAAESLVPRTVWEYTSPKGFWGTKIRSKAFKPGARRVVRAKVNEAVKLK